jgi:uncharacterized membrane protein
MMTSDTRPDPETVRQQVLLAARLTPHRSLGRRGFIILMVFICLVSFIAGLAFWLMGAWPVFGFFGLDVLLVWWAFRVNFRQARAFEEVRVTYDEVKIRRVSHRGHVVVWSFNPVWVRIDRQIHEEFGLERLYLTARGRRVSLGSFLGAEEKERFDKVLTAALSEARRGPTYNTL